MRAFVFIDGQNLFGHAKEAWGYRYATYDPKQLAQWACEELGYELGEIHFYTGIHEVTHYPFLHYWWRSKLDHIRNSGVRVFTRKLRYTPVERITNDITTIEQVPREKGVDVRMALDIVRFALDKAYDAALIFSQDQDLSEAVDDVRAIARLQHRAIPLHSVYPDAPRQRGINKTKWLNISKAEYDARLDTIDHHKRAEAQSRRR